MKCLRIIKTQRAFNLVREAVGLSNLFRDTRGGGKDSFLIARLPWPGPQQSEKLLLSLKQELGISDEQQMAMLEAVMNGEASFPAPARGHPASTSQPAGKKGGAAGAAAGQRKGVCTAAGSGAPRCSQALAARFGAEPPPALPRQAEPAPAPRLEAARSRRPPLPWARSALSTSTRVST